MFKEESEEELILELRSKDLNNLNDILAGFSSEYNIEFNDLVGMLLISILKCLDNYHEGDKSIITHNYKEFCEQAYMSFFKQETEQ